MGSENIAFYLDNLFGKGETTKVGERHEYTLTPAHVESQIEINQITLDFSEFGKCTINGFIRGVSTKRGELNMASEAQIKRAIVKGRIFAVKVFGSGRVIRLQSMGRCLYSLFGELMYYTNLRKHPRRALIIHEGHKTPVRLKGKNRNN